ERHIVIDDFEHGDAAAQGGLTAQANRRFARGSALQQVPGALREGGEFLRLVPYEVLDRRAAEQQGGKLCRHVATTTAQDQLRLGDERPPCPFRAAAQKTSRVQAAPPQGGVRDTKACVDSRKCLLSPAADVERRRPDSNPAGCAGERPRAMRASK